MSLKGKVKFWDSVFPKKNGMVYKGLVTLAFMSFSDTVFS